MQLHGSAASREGRAVLLMAPPGGGKSDLLLRLLDRGWALVADDQVALRAEGGRLLAAPPPALAGMVEARGLGLLTRLPWAEAELALAVHLASPADIPRLPAPEAWEALGVALPAIRLDAAAASAPVRLERALDVLAGRLGLAAGAFAA